MLPHPTHPSRALWRWFCRFIIIGCRRLSAHCNAAAAHCAAATAFILQ
jgi:hypothetical protein